MTTRTSRDKWRLISLIAAVVLTACASPGSALIGEWRSSAADVIFEFFGDGTVTWDQANRSFTGQYKFLDDHNLRLDMRGDLGPQTVVLKDVNISDDTLTVVFEGKMIEFTRVTDGAQASTAQPQTAQPQPTVPAGGLKTESFQHPLGKIRTVKGQLQFFGDLQLHALTNQDNLVEGQATHFGVLDFSVQESGGQATVKAGLKGVSGANSSVNQGETWDVGLNSAVTYDLFVELGVGKSVLDLSQLKLSHARIDGGAGEAELRLPSVGTFILDIDGGVSKLRILVPTGMAMKATIDTGLGKFDPGGRLLPDGADGYVTADFASATNAITLKIKMGVGDIRIEDLK